MFRNVKRWTYGLLAGFIGGGAGAASTAITAMILDPKMFNFGDALGVQNVFKSMIGSFVIMGLFNAFAYLAKAPLPELGNGDTQFLTKPTNYEKENQKENT
jgi:hypothetical protein